MDYLFKVMLISIIATIILGYAILPILKRRDIGQNIRVEGPESHYTKAGTPTMGGVIFLVSTFLISLIFIPFNMETFIILLSMIGFGAIGFIDDFRKLILKQSEGLKPKEKIVLQFSLALIITILAYFNNPLSITALRIPFTSFYLPVSILGFPILVFIIVGTTNAVNLTDGVDGLASSVSIPVFLTLAVLSINDSTRIFPIIMAGALIGFLLFNSNPAAVFMGDTGSLALGGAIVALSILDRIPIYLIIFGGIYMIETLSVIIQVISYKKRKKRIFLMTPIHHHFELKGYKEPKIVAGFSIVSVLLCLITLVSIL